MLTRLSTASIEEFIVDEVGKLPFERQRLIALTVAEFLISFYYDFCIEEDLEEMADLLQHCFRKQWINQDLEECDLDAEDFILETDSFGNYFGTTGRFSAEGLFSLIDFLQDQEVKNLEHALLQIHRIFEMLYDRETVSHGVPLNELEEGESMFRQRWITHLNEILERIKTMDLEPAILEQLHHEVVIFMADFDELMLEIFED